MRPVVIYVRKIWTIPKKKTESFLQKIFTNVFVWIKMARGECESINTNLNL